MVARHVALIIFVMTCGDKVVLFIKESMEPESFSTLRSLQLLTIFMVSVVHIVTGDSFLGRTIFGLWLL